MALNEASNSSHLRSMEIDGLFKCTCNNTFNNHFNLLTATVWLSQDRHGEFQHNSIKKYSRTKDRKVKVELIERVESYTFTQKL